MVGMEKKMASSAAVIGDSDAEAAWEVVKESPLADGVDVLAVSRAGVVCRLSEHVRLSIQITTQDRVDKDKGEGKGLEVRVSLFLLHDFLYMIHATFLIIGICLHQRQL